MGCYTDTSIRVLPNVVGYLMRTVSQCLQYVKSLNGGYKYFGVQGWNSYYFYCVYGSNSLEDIMQYGTATCGATDSEGFSVGGASVNALYSVADAGRDL